MLKPEHIDRIYIDLIRDLKAIIQSKGTILGFCAKHKINRPNLMAVFSENNSKEISVGLYQRVCIALEIIPDTCVSSEHSSLFNLSLKQYLLIDNNAIRDSINIISIL